MDLYSLKLLSMSKKLRLLVIGTKFGSTYLDAAKDSSHFEIAGCVARTKESLKEAQTKFKIDPTCLYTDVKVALDKIPNIDAVAVAVPNKDHYGIAKMVLDHDYNLIIEKPITDTWEQAVDLVKRLDQHPSKKAMVGQTLRGEVMIRLLAEQIKSGIIGKIEQIIFESHYNWSGNPAKSWRFGLENMFLDDIGIHQIDEIRMLTGNKKCLEVIAQSSTPKSYPLQHIKTSVSGIWTMEDNIRVHYFGSMGLGGENIGWYGRVSIFGEKGSVHRDAAGEPYMILNGESKRTSLDSDNIEEIVPMIEFEKIPYLLEDFYHAITENRPPITDLHDNLNSHAILLGMKRSAQEKRPVNIQKEFVL
jgi:predicted dehydrogenase